MRNPYNRTLLLTISLIALIFFANVFFNRLVDPYGYFLEPRIASFNSNKIYISRDRAVLSAQPEALILGSSRAYLGLNPKDKAWQGKKVFNLAAGGDSIFDSLHFLEYANQNTQIKEAFLLIDFFMFNATRKPYNEDEYDYLSLISLDENITDTNIFGSLFSFKTLIDSFNTVINQNKFSSDLMNYGLTSFAPDLPRHSKFRSTESAFYKVHYRNFITQTLDKNMLDGFERIVSYADKNNIRLTIGISPMHARLLEVIDMAGLWDDFETWKKSITHIIKLQNENGLSSQFKLYDFATYNRFSIEESPLQTKHNDVTWFSDPSHYKRNLGTSVIDRMLGAPLENNQFGVDIDQGNIEEHLTTIRAERDVWRDQYPAHATEIQSMSR